MTYQQPTVVAKKILFLTANKVIGDIADKYNMSFKKIHNELCQKLTKLIVFHEHKH